MQIDNRVSHQLAGAVVGNVAAAVDIVDRDTTFQQLLRREEDVVAAAPAAEGEGVRMLEEQQNIRDSIATSRLGELPLQSPGFVVIDASQAAHE
jgi:hypothetical protein